MGGVDDSSSASEKSDHLPVTAIVGLPVMRLANQEKRSRHSRALPPGPRTVSVAETHFDSEARHQRTIERESPVKVTNANEDVRKQFDLRPMGMRRTGEAWRRSTTCC